MELHLSDELYTRFRDLLLTRCGLHYPERKRTDLEHGLNQAIRASGRQSFAELYANMLHGGPDWEAVLEHLTIGETYFFRNRAQFDALEQQIWPELLDRKAALRNLRIWSAGCATGEEPYSLAMSLNDRIPDESWQVSILATDINALFLNRAREGLYSAWSFRETPDVVRDRFFTPEQNRWRLRAEIRRKVLFARLNLAEAGYPSVVNGTCALDLIVCRNVMIYFDEATIRQVVGRFYAALAPGGWLVVGHAEPQASIYHQFEVHNFPHTVIYRKSLKAPLFGFDPVRGVFAAGSQPILTPGLHATSGAATPAAPPPVAATLPRTAPPATLPAPPPRTSALAAPVAERWTIIRARLDQGDKANTEALLHDLLKLEPTHVPALIALARLQADRGDWTSAQQSSETALQHDPLCVEAHFLQAQICEHQGLFSAALAAYRRTVYLDRTFVSGMIGMANVWRQMGHSDDARRVYRNALKQLTLMDPGAPVPGGEGILARDLVALATHQLQNLE